MTFGDKLSGIFGRKRREQLSASALEPDHLRDALIRESEPDVPRFGAMLQNRPEIGNERHPATWETFPELARDVARAAVSYDEPKVLARDKVLPSHVLNRDILFQVLGTPEFGDVRRHSVGDAEDALFSTLTLQEAMKEHAGELAEHIERANEAREVESVLGGIDERLQELRDQAKAFKDAEQPLPAGHVDEVKRLIGQRELEQDALTKIDAESSGTPAIAAKVAKSAAGAAAAVAQTIGQLQGLAPGMIGTKDPEERFKMALQWAANPRLKRILDEAGRLARTVKFARQERSKNVPVQPVGITTGREIGRLLPHELASAHSPELRGLFAKRYSQRALLEYRMDGKEPANKGPVITVVDGSGSMSVGARIEHAKALELAMLNLAARERRAFACVEFGGPNQSRSRVFPAGKLDGADVLRWAGQFYHSAGTDIGAGLEHALKIVRQQDAFKTADVILMTDGQCKFGDGDQLIVDQLKELGVKIHGISVAAPNNRYLKLACDWHVELADITELGDAAVRLAGEIT